MRLLVEKYEEGTEAPFGESLGEFYSPGREWRRGPHPPRKGELSTPVWRGQRAATSPELVTGGTPGVSLELRELYVVPVTPEVAINFVRSPSFVNSPSFLGNTSPGLSPTPPPSQPSVTLDFSGPKVLQRSRSDDVGRRAAGVILATAGARPGAEGHHMTFFNAIHHAWVFFIIVSHAAFVILALRWYQRNNREAVLGKMQKTGEITLLGRLLRLPEVDDTKLLLVCLAWRSSRFMSDATDPEGHFWWCACFAKQPKRGKFSSTDPSEVVLPVSLFNFIVGMETGLILLVCYFTRLAWAHSFFNTASS